MTGCQLRDETRHYEVTSPVYLYGDYNAGLLGGDPPEPRCAWGVFEAETPAKAKAQAIKDPDFRSWVDDADHPFRGLTVRLFRCEHGTCLACVEDEFCPECEAEFGEDDVA